MYRTVIFSIYKIQEVCPAIWFCCYTAHTETSKKRRSKVSLWQYKGWHQPNFIKQTNKITNRVSKIQLGNSDLTINKEWVTTRLVFTVQLSLGKTLPISHTQEYASKPLFTKKMPFKSIYHKAKMK